MSPSRADGNRVILPVLAFRSVLRPALWIHLSSWPDVFVFRAGLDLRSTPAGPLSKSEGGSMTAGVVRGQSKNLILAAMIFAVAMTFIDQTIVSIAVPQIQRELGLSSTGVQWAVNAYLLALAALFAFGGRLADTLGHRKMVVLGVIIFAAASAMCGLTPKGTFAEAWIVTFRAIQGAGGAIMFPAALAIVVSTFELRERGKALATFFGIAGGLTAIGPVLGGYLTEWTWRAIFWVNLPVAAIALVLIVVSKPTTQFRPARVDVRGLIMIAVGVALSVFGFQQSQIWGWSNPGTGLCIGAGIVILVAFYFVEFRTPVPLIQVRIFRIRAFLVENMVLGIAMLVFVPVFFFASEYAQIALGDSASEAGLYLLYFFIGFAIAAQIGGRMLDAGGAKRPVVLGCALAAVGFALWAGEVSKLRFGSQEWYVILAGAGMGFMLGPASTDAVNRASKLSYGEATGITQTVRNYAASLGLAILGTILVSQMRSRITTSLISQGVPANQAAQNATSISQSQSGSGSVASIPHFVRLDFAYATRSVLYVMAGIMVLAAIVGLIGLRPGVQEELAEELDLVADSIAESESGTTAPLADGPIVGSGVDEHGGAEI
ncbi:MAG TPA: MFS transporter [Acidimicrobiales bacterium]